MTQASVESGKNIDPPFEEHLKTAAGGFRSAILELMSTVGADPGRPQEVARRFGLRSGLTWKVCKVVQEADVRAAIPHIPGSAGVKLFLDAIEKAGAPAETVEVARQASRAFERMVEIHTGDRSTLEMMVSDMQSTPAQAEQIRKQAYQGNSGTYGVRAKAQLTLNILAPNADEPTQCDLVQVGGLISFRRLRRDARWLLFRRERWAGDSLQEEPDRWEPLDPEGASDHGIPLLTQFCSKPLPEIDVVTDIGEDQYELPPGPIGNAAALTCIYGSVSRAVGPAYGDEPGEYSELGPNLITPAQHLLFDLFVHRDFEWAMQPEFVICSRMDGGPVHMAIRRERNYLPVPEGVHDLGWGITACATPILSKYTKLLNYTFNRLSWNAEDFRAFRVTMRYPPIPTVALLRSELPLRDA
ncbi:MAG: hypothetical protein KAS72_13915 [Phycisphaerales bacterium]|nr:hypothetical protein [Phycisphaerales bacterium]